MVYEGVLEGRYVDLKACTEDDAEFTRAIRNAPEFAKHLPALNNTVEEQREWIRNQRRKEGDYFFVVWDKNGNRIGTISIYGINGTNAESGRLAIKGSNPFQALEAQILIFRFAFDVLGLMCMTGFIYEDNDRALRFNKQFGGKHFPPETDGEGRMIVRYEIRKDSFAKVDAKMSSMLYRVKKSKGDNHNE